MRFQHKSLKLLLAVGFFVAAFVLAGTPTNALGCGGSGHGGSHQGYYSDHGHGGSYHDYGAYYRGHGYRGHWGRYRGGYGRGYGGGYGRGYGGGHH
jgi:hypothetical protein